MMFGYKDPCTLPRGVKGPHPGARLGEPKGSDLQLLKLAVGTWSAITLARGEPEPKTG